MSLIEGKQKAWIAALVGFVSALALQLAGGGEGPTDAQIADLASITGEIAVSLAVAALNWVAVYLKTNRVDGQPVVQAPAPTHPEGV